jgi:hypothetical protein
MVIAYRDKVVGDILCVFVRRFKEFAGMIISGFDRQDLPLSLVHTNVPVRVPISSCPLYFSL